MERASPDCVLNEENTIEVKPFVKSDGDCKSLCQQVSEMACSNSASRIILLSADRHIMIRALVYRRKFEKVD